MDEVLNPVLQAAMALCSHESFVRDCDACEVRRREACSVLAEMAEAALNGRP